MGKILLEEMEFFAYHGCFDEEKVIGNQFIVNLEIETDTATSEKSDDLLETINYQEIYNVIGEVMNQSCNLLEHLTSKILDVLMDKFPAIEYAKLKISKINPPMGGRMRSVSVELERGR